MIDLILSQGGQPVRSYLLHEKKSCGYHWQSFKPLKTTQLNCVFPLCFLFFVFFLCEGRKISNLINLSNLCVCICICILYKVFFTSLFLFVRLSIVTMIYIIIKNINSSEQKWWKVFEGDDEIVQRIIKFDEKISRKNKDLFWTKVFLLFWTKVRKIIDGDEN